MILFILIFLANVAEGVGCDYLTGADGRYHEDYLRPSVVIADDIARVEVFMRTGRSAARRVDFFLYPVEDGYADAAGNTLTYTRKGQAVLTLNGLRAHCVR